jgi:hypothetical protein
MPSQLSNSKKSLYTLDIDETGVYWMYFELFVYKMVCELSRAFSIL